MNVLQVTPFFPPDIGGIPDHVYNLSKNLKKMDNNVTIVTPLKWHSKKVYSDEFSVISIPSLYPLSWPYPTLKNMGIPMEMGLKIKYVIKHGGFDIIHCHGQHYPICWMAASSAAKFGIPVMLTVHTTYGLNPFKMGGKTVTEELFNKTVFSFLLKKTNGVIGLTYNNIIYAKKYNPKSCNYYQITNGINSENFLNNLMNKSVYRKQFRINQESVVVLFCGRFEHVKSVIEFTNAMSAIINEDKKIVVFMVGQGSLEHTIRELIKGKRNIHLFNWQSADELYKFYILSDIFVIPSKYEGLPIALLEAMAASLHIVYTPVGSIPEILENYYFKTLAKQSDNTSIYSAVKDAIKSLNKDNPNIIPHNISFNFDWKNIASETMKAYQEVIGDNHSNTV